MISRLLIATRNPGKLAEMSQLLSGLVGEIISPSADDPEVEEDADTLEGNALKKARVLAERYGLPTVADDTGLEVDALGGRPGVYSARYAGPDCTPADNVSKLLSELGTSTTRSARFRTVVAYVDGTEAHCFHGVCEGAIIDHPRGRDGFGYDPVFLPDGESETFAELPSERKNAISHRGRAVRDFVRFLADGGESAARERAAATPGITAP